jgi:leader peptidase (prepilin peptidase) / N-methyltransferase
MLRYEMLQWGLKATWLLLVFAYGACIGSLLNVVAYRMPKGISIVTPPSRCPKCGTRLSWRDNIPVLGWLLLRGKCRYCRNPISAEYPLVELSVGLLFALFYAQWYMITRNVVVLGVDLTAFRPEWMYNDAFYTWPTFALLLVLLGSLAAMTLVDAKTFTIPLILAWIPAVAALIVHPLHALWLELRLGEMTARMQAAPGYIWAIPTPGEYGWAGIGAALGGLAGLAIANVLLHLGLIRRSFADYAEWEASVAARAPVSENPSGEPTVQPAEQAPAGAVKLEAVPDVGMVADPERPADMWIQYPHARREMLKELVFLSPVVSLGLIGMEVARRWARVEIDPITLQNVAAVEAPLWLSVLSGVILGYLIGGGIVWLVRILGSLAFGKEAMGLGDVHLMAAVGACLGWIDATLAFFGAAFVGLFWHALMILKGGTVKRAMPYGPFLAVSTVLVLLLKPLVERGLSWLAHGPVNLP